MVAGQRLIFGSTPTGQRATLNVIAAFERRYCYPETGAAFVRQAAKAASGGQATNVEIASSLAGHKVPSEMRSSGVIGALIVNPQAAEAENEQSVPAWRQFTAGVRVAFRRLGPRLVSCGQREWRQISRLVGGRDRD